jgi:hypothetical protein
LLRVVVKCCLLLKHVGHESIRDTCHPLHVVEFYCASSSTLLRVHLTPIWWSLVSSRFSILDSKRSRREYPALGNFGFSPNAMYIKAVTLLQACALATGYSRPTSLRGRLLSFQAPWVKTREAPIPPGFDSLRASLGDKVAYAQAAAHLPSPLAGAVPTLEPHVRCAIDFIVDMGDDIGPWRLSQFEKVNAIAASLRPLSQHMLATCPSSLAWVGGPDPNPAFACAVIDALQLPNTLWPVKMYKYGFSLIGVAPDTGLWRLKSDEDLAASTPSVPAALLYSTSKKYTCSLVAQLESSFAKTKQAARGRSSSAMKAIELANAAWDASMKEVTAKGSAAGPFSYNELRAHLTRLGVAHDIEPRPVPRHAVQQELKIRPVDNATRGLFNAAYQCVERVCLMPADFTAAVGRYIFDLYFARGSPCPQIGASKEDEPNAYRNVPVRELEFCIAVIVNPRTGKANFFPIRGHGFGFAAAVPNFTEKTTTMCIVAALLFATPCSNYIDDFTTPDTLVSRGPEVVAAFGRHRFPASAQAGLWMTASLLGSPLSDDPTKSFPHSNVSNSCGVQTDLTRTHLTGEVRLRIKPSTRVKVLSLVRATRESRSCFGASASTLRGKLGWITMLGKPGRAVSQIFNDRQSLARDPGYDDTLDRGLSFIESLLSSDSLPDLVFPGVGRHSQVVTIFSDASWEPRPPLRFGYACLAFVAFFPNGSILYSSCPVPYAIFAKMYALQPRISPIAALETMALAGAYFSIPSSYLAGSDVNHFGDSKAANGCIARGYSPSPDMARMASAHHIHVTRMSTRVWIEWVPSASNIADLPSRPDEPGSLDDLRALHATPIDFVLPSLSSWSAW